MFFYKRLYRLFLLKFKLICDNIHISIVLSLFISICITCFISLILNNLRENFLVINNSFCQDLGVILGSKIVDLIDWNNCKPLVSFIEKVYISTSSIRYILLFHTDGTLFLSVPTYASRIQDLLQLHQSLLQLETHDFLFNTPLVKYSTLFNDNITDILIPLIKDGYNIASLDIGINSNFLFYTSLSFIHITSLIIFILIWLVSFTISFTNNLIFKFFLKQIFKSINNISSGNFNYKMHLHIYDDFNNLAIKFNAMVDQLKYFEEQNINKLMIEKSKLELIIETIDYGVILLDSELRVLSINDAANKVCLVHTKDLVGKSIINYLPFHVIQALLPILNNLVEYNCFEQKFYKHEEISIHLNDNCKTVVHFILKTVIDKTNLILIGVIMIIKDISKEVSLNETKNQFLSNVSHELRTPLCNINSFLETLLDYNNSLLEYQKIKFLKIANHETRRLSKLVNDILDLSKLDSNPNYLLENLDIGPILKYIMNTFQIIAQKNNIKLVLEIDSSINYVLAHESSLCQVLSNLLSNSIKFTNYNGYIIIRVYSLITIHNDYTLLPSINHRITNIVRIEIIDEGIGIDKINQLMVFHRFVRIENNVHILQGTGLGLSIVKNILGKYETNIYVHSFLKVGTSVSFDLIQTS